VQNGNSLNWPTIARFNFFQLYMDEEPLVSRFELRGGGIVIPTASGAHRTEEHFQK